MAGNPERRAALVDAGVEVLAREGARGLTFRAVDVEAGVPVGTASNYFTGRDDRLPHGLSRPPGDAPGSHPPPRTARLVHQVGPRRPRVRHGVPPRRRATR